MAVELHAGTAGGNVQLKELHVGTAGGNIELKELWVGTASGNKKIFQALQAPATAPLWATGYPKDDPATSDDTLLQLQAVTDATEYDVYYRVGSSMGGDPVANGTLLSGAAIPAASIVGTEYQHSTGEAAGTVIYYQARARNAAGAGPFGTEESVTLVEAAPSTAPGWATGYPQDNSADDDGILAKLTAVGDADAYDLFYRFDASMSGDPVANADGSVTGLTAAQIVSAAYNLATGQPHGTVVYLQARGTNDGGAGPFGTEASATVAVRLPGTPANVSATDLGGGTARITWTQPSPDNETIYRLEQQYQTTPGGGWTTEFTFTNPANDLSVDRIMTEDRNYRWRVRAENAAGATAYVESNELLYMSAPGTPTGVALAYDGTNPDSELQLSWTPPASGGPFDGYEIEYIAYASAFTGTPNDTSGVDSSERLTGLADDTRYKARLRAVHSGWGTAGSWSAEDDEWTAPSALSPPTLTVTATGDDTLELDSSTVPDADEYAFYDSGGSLLVQQAGEVHNRTGLSANTQYGQYAKAVNKASVGSPHSDVYSAASATVSKYTLVSVPQSFDGIRDTSVCPADAFDFTWSNLNGDGVARSETMTFEIKATSGGSYSVVDSAVAAGSTSFRYTAGPAVAGRVKYNSEATYAEDTNLGLPCPE